MRSLVAMALALVVAPGPARADDPAATPPGNFKLVFAYYELGDKPVIVGELVFHDGVAFQFEDKTREVAAIDPGRARVDLIRLDAGDLIQTRVSFTRLDRWLSGLHDELGASIAGREKEGGKANRIAARMTRDLIDPKFSASFDAEGRRLSLANATVQVRAVGEPEPDAARLALVVETLKALAKLGSMRDIESIPPFSRLAAIDGLAAEHKLRPADLTFIYRLAGPPQRFRWTYRLVDTLTDRELEALARLEKVRAEATSVDLERFTRRGGG